MLRYSKHPGPQSGKMMLLGLDAVAMPVADEVRFLAHDIASWYLGKVLEGQIGATY